jgi:hypothetical protein
VTNPYATPNDESGADEPSSSPPHAIRWTILWSFGLCVGLGVLGLLAGWFVGGWAYDAYPLYYNDVIYPAGMFTEYSEKVRIQVSIRTALVAGGFGFWAGLLAPWALFAWRRFTAAGP